MVKSVSCPTPEITGTAEAAIARATVSSLKAHRSSSEPPPRATITTSANFGAIEIAQARDDFTGRSFALHFYGIELHVNIREAALEDAENVSNRRAGGRGDDADAARQDRQRLFARFVEEALFLQLLFKLLEGELERAESDRLDVRDVNLIFAAQFVDAERAAHGDVQAVLGAELQGASLVAETDAANLRARIFQGEVEMSRLRRAVIRDFAFDPDVAEGALEKFGEAFR